MSAVTGSLCVTDDDGDLVVDEDTAAAPTMGKLLVPYITFE